MNDPPRARPTGSWRRPGAWIVAALLLAVVAVPSGLAAAHLVRVAPEVGLARPIPATNATFSVTLTDAPAYLPRYLNSTVSGTVNVSVDLDNTGSIAHTFTTVNASQAGKVLSRSMTPANLTAYFATYPPLENVSVAPGTSAWANFSLPSNRAFRSLEFVSTFPYQFQAGMWGFLNLTPAGPTLLLSENTTDALQFVPNVLSAGPSVHGAVTLHILVTNLGSLGHTFTVSSQDNVTLTTVGSFASHPPLANASVPSSGSVWANFTVPSVGVFEYACTVTGHFAAGMYGFLYVGVPVPPPPPAPSTAIVAVAALIGLAVLLGVGLVLTLAAAYTGRFPKKPGSAESHR